MLEYKMPKIAVIGTKGGWSSEKLADTVAEMTATRLLVDMNRVRVDLEEGGVWYGDLNLSTLDAVIIKKVASRYSADLLDRLELLRFLSNLGVPVFSAPERILRVVDRLSCTVSLRNAGIPMPPTTVTEDIEEAANTIERYGEAVLKPLYTSKARGMAVVRYDSGIREVLAEFKAGNPILYIQKKIDIPEQDLGIAFLGGAYLTTYARRKQNDTWNTTTRSGGKYASYTPSSAIIELARKAQDLFELDFTCVDVALTGQGPCVFEVSAFGGFRGIQETSDIDPAERYVRYVLDCIGRRGER